MNSVGWNKGRANHVESFLLHGKGAITQLSVVFDANVCQEKESVISAASRTFLQQEVRDMNSPISLGTFYSQSRND